MTVLLFIEARFTEDANENNVVNILNLTLFLYNHCISTWYEF